ncbi:MAG: class I lanthipeptide [Janthinobacterium lividum]
MKKKQITNKLSLNKQTLSQLDAQALNAIKGGGNAPTGTDDPKPTQPC